MSCLCSSCWTTNYDRYADGQRRRYICNNYDPDHTSSGAPKHSTPPAGTPNSKSSSPARCCLRNCSPRSRRYVYATDTHKHKQGNTSSLMDKRPCYDCPPNFANVHTAAETEAKDMNDYAFDTHRHHPPCSSDPMRSLDTSASCDCPPNFANVHTAAMLYARHGHARHSDCTCNTRDPPHTSSHVKMSPRSSSTYPLDRPRAVPDTCAYVSDTHSRCQLCNSALMRWLDKRPSCGCPPNFGNAHTAAAGPLPDTSAYAIDTHSKSQLCNSALMRSSDKRPNCGCPPNFGNAHTAAAGPLPDTSAYAIDTHSKSQLCNSALMRWLDKRRDCDCEVSP